MTADNVAPGDQTGPVPGAASTDLARSAATAVGWSAVAQVTRVLAQFVIQLALARILEPTTFGLIGMVIVVAGFASLIAEFGVEQALVQRAYVREAHYNAGFWLNLMMSLLLAMVVVAASGTIASFYGEAELTRYVPAIAATLPLAALGSVHRARLQRQFDFRRLTAIEAGSFTIGGVAAVTAALAGAGAWSLVVQAVATPALSAMALWLTTTWRPSASVEAAAGKDILSFTAPLVGFSVMNYWARNADNLLVGRYLGAATLGLYARAYAIMLLPLTQISAVLGKVMFVSLSKMQGDLSRLRHAYLRTVGVISLVTFPMMLGLLATTEDFVLAVLGEKWRGTIPILRIFSLIGMVQSIVTTVGWLYLSQGRSDLLLRWGVAASSVFVASFVVGVAIGTALAVAVAYACAMAILTYPAIAIPARLVGLRASQVAQSVAGPLTASSLMAVTVWIASALLPSGGPLLRLALLTAGGAVLYILLLVLGRVSAAKDAMALLKECRGAERRGLA